MVAKKKPAPKKEKPQKQRFIEAARKAGVDESGQAFDHAIKKIAPPRKPPPRKA